MQVTNSSSSPRPCGRPDKVVELLSRVSNWTKDYRDVTHKFGNSREVPPVVHGARQSSRLRGYPIEENDSGGGVETRRHCNVHRVVANVDTKKSVRIFGTLLIG